MKSNVDSKPDSTPESSNHEGKDATDIDGVFPGSNTTKPSNEIDVNNEEEICTI
jgi:hypothetical protein